jgi:hypothetical protein
MASFQVDVGVLTVRPHTLKALYGKKSHGASTSQPQGSQNASKSLETLHAVFATAGARNNGEERPQKRRKTGTDGYACTHPAYFQDHRSVVLAKVSFKLVGLHAETQSTLN